MRQRKKNEEELLRNYQDLLKKKDKMTSKAVTDSNPFKVLSKLLPGDASQAMYSRRSSIFWSWSDDEHPPVSFKDAEYKNTNRKKYKEGIKE